MLSTLKASEQNEWICVESVKRMSVKVNKLFEAKKMFYIYTCFLVQKATEDSLSYSKCLFYFPHKKSLVEIERATDRLLMNFLKISKDFEARL